VDFIKYHCQSCENTLKIPTNLIGKTKGNGSATFKYLRKKLLEAVVKLEPKAREIIIDETIKALGCSQEQTYKGVSARSLQLQPLPLMPQGPNDGSIYIPVQSVDFFSNLKQAPTPGSAVTSSFPLCS
jgi:hypothetical protein